MSTYNSSIQQYIPEIFSSKIDTSGENIIVKDGIQWSVPQFKMYFLLCLHTTWCPMGLIVYSLVSLINDHVGFLASIYIFFGSVRRNVLDTKCMRFCQYVLEVWK